MANSYDTNLTNKIVLTRGISKLQGKLAYLTNFTSDFSDEIRDMRSRYVAVPFVSGGSAALVADSSTNFQTGDTGTVTKPVLLQHVYKTFSIDSIDYGSGSRLDALADANATLFANKIESIVFSLLTTGNYGTAAVGGLSGTMTASHMNTLWNSIQGGYKVAILKANKYSDLAATDRFGFDIKNDLRPYNFDKIDYTDNGFASAGANIVGFGAAKSGIIVASALPAFTNEVASLLETEVMEIPELGISVQANLWADVATKKTYMSFETLFGAAVGDPDALKLVSA